MEFRQQLQYPPFSRVALLTLKGRSEDKVKFYSEHLRRELEKALKPVPTDGAKAANAPVEKNEFKDLIIAGPAPAPLLKAETFYRYQIMLRTRAMSRLSQQLAKIIIPLTLAEDVTLSVDIDPVDLS